MSANSGAIETQLTVYHAGRDYDGDLAVVDSAAQPRVVANVTRTPRPALDIDETSLTNRPHIAANDFSYLPGGGCHALPAGLCGSVTWELAARASVIAPTLALFNAAEAAGVAVFFITGRPESERAATEKNLHTVGYDGWTGLTLKPATLHFTSAAEYKSAERARIEAHDYTIIANVGDQQSDLTGGHVLHSFPLPNPFYFIP